MVLRAPRRLHKYHGRDQRQDAEPQRRKGFNFLIFFASLRLCVSALIPSVVLMQSLNICPHKSTANFRTTFGILGGAEGEGVDAGGEPFLEGGGAVV